MSELFGDVFITSVVPGCLLRRQQIEDEVRQYKTEPCISPESNPLDWWKCHELKYPNLAKLAKCVLAIPATSVPSERIFSTAGDIVNAQRACRDWEGRAPCANAHKTRKRRILKLLTAPRMRLSHIMVSNA